MLWALGLEDPPAPHSCLLCPFQLRAALGGGGGRAGGGPWDTGCRSQVGVPETPALLCPPRVAAGACSSSPPQGRPCTGVVSSRKAGQCEPTGARGGRPQNARLPVFSHLCVPGLAESAGPAEGLGTPKVFWMDSLFCDSG